ncbi:PepSY domain-containing protein [Aureimonas jatrophae]|jgi:hypothetical protein|uniref:Peptidase propeptide and YPEB domain-containing protein n=1 Tax=Aureimonas jatrophae TaxID=1166073 RepID=A0A1H0HKE1_9HYPH|nr:PepSY domain-containing protein [Aureimonas jatrophae]MBB3950636.1 hypothetical protein [Aureimonas jatrophae]SDO19658.1 Peptidase propeptide and YPEB domain-containing protein [Aureimonas jatrophae]
MTIRSLLRVGLVAALASLTAAPVLAQGIQIGPDGVRVLPDDRGPPGYDGPRRFRDEPPPRRREITEREAVRIARSQGMREVDDVFSRGRTIRVEGGDRRGRDLTVIIDRRSGDIVDVR